MPQKKRAARKPPPPQPTYNGTQAAETLRRAFVDWRPAAQSVPKALQRGGCITMTPRINAVNSAAFEHRMIKNEKGRPR